MNNEKKSVKQVNGVLAAKINAWLLAHALKYARWRVLEILQELFGVTFSLGALGKRESRLGIVRDLSVEFHRNRVNGQPSLSEPPPEPTETPPATPPPRPPPTVDERIALDRQLGRAQNEARQNKTRYQQLLKQIELVEAERDAALAVSGAAHTPVVIEARRRRGTSEAVAVVLASDWHVEEEVKPGTVNGLNRYHLDIAEARAKTFFERVLRMVKKERQDVHIDTLVLGLLGDFITGRIHEENLETCLLRPVHAIIFVQDLLISGIQFLLNNSDLNLVIPCRPGNHSRITKKVHASTEDGNSLETMMYATLRQRFAGEQRVTFITEESYHVYVPVFGHTLRLHHGHAVQYQGGVGGLHIPLKKALAAWDQTRQSTVDGLGHWHMYLPDMRYVVNGSLIGYSAYALRGKFPYAPPIQAFFLIDKERGVTVQIPLFVQTSVEHNLSVTVR